MKSIKMFGKSVPLLAIVIVSVLVVGATAGLLDYYGRINSTVTVEQSLKLDDESWPDSVITEAVNGVAGNTIYGDWHHLDNMADKTILFSMTSTEPEGLADVYPEFKLDANYYDDAFRVILSSDIYWNSFIGISFDYEILSGPLDYIPQINLVLRDSGEVGRYYASWHSFRTGEYGTVGTPASITYDKGDFYIYELPSWKILGLWSDTEWWDVPNVSKLSAGDTTALKATITALDLEFSYFSHQAGETSVDPNTVTDILHSSGHQQVVLVSNHATDVPIDGMGVFSSAGLETLDFRMVYIFEDHATEDIYTVTTDIEPYP